MLTLDDNNNNNSSNNIIVSVGGMGAKLISCLERGWIFLNLLFQDNFLVPEWEIKIKIETSPFEAKKQQQVRIKKKLMIG